MTIYPEEFTTIVVDLNLDGRDVLVVPRDDTASAVLQQILDQAPESLKLHSGGMAGNHQKITGAYLYCGGVSYSRTENHMTSTDYRGAIKVHLDLTAATDEFIGVLRGNMWYGIKVDPSSSVDNFRLQPAKPCKVCGNPLANFGEMEWTTCESCASKCEHQYVEGVGTINGNIAHMPFCDLCGRVDPGWQPNENPIADLLNTVAAGDLAMLVLDHQDGSTTSITKQ